MPTEKEIDEVCAAFLEANKEPDSPKPNLNVHTPQQREKSWAAEELRRAADRRRMPIERQVG